MDLNFAPAVGHFDQLCCRNGKLFVQGWLFAPDQAIDSITLFLDGDLVASFPCRLREDVGAAYPWIPYAHSSGFSFNPDQVETTQRVDIVGLWKNSPVARLSTVFRTDLDEIVSLPPRQLMKRVSFGVSDYLFKLHGLKMFGDLMEQIGRFSPLSQVRCMLDWGCGCGRVTRHFLLEQDRPIIHGCDIDGEAVEWCGHNLDSAEFRQIEPYPPTPYADGMFDLVTACSVFTHLSEALQTEWLKEMRRIIVPGGILLASTHGRFAFLSDYHRSLALYKRVFPLRGVHPRWIRILLRCGSLFPDIVKNLFDRSPCLVEVRLENDLALEGIAPAGYYLSVYQSRSYVYRNWGKYFEVLDYINLGLNAHQDLVVLRRPA
ncbi:MAG TPA: class I SAM-dependent methyltransferase [Acidobacteriota bacterium]|jgi:SAM-dependent methyltransferase